MATEHVDVLIVGAGLSGIGAACHLRQRSPDRTFTILESRHAIGGTWDLFRYPGVRSDSDMFTLGYSFSPWTEAEAIADGTSIREYVRRTAAKYDIDPHIRFHHKVVGAEWSTEDARWTVTADRTDPESGVVEKVTLTCSFLYVCSGYYRYDKGYTPSFQGVEDFTGQVVHPQHWPEDLDYAGKRVVVIGSGATAITLVPSMSETAAHVTMVQRSPSYVLTLPGKDIIADKLIGKVPPRFLFPALRWKNVLTAMLAFQLSRRAPKVMKTLLRKGVLAQVPSGYDVDTHFAPTYNPWDQRMCFVPDGDLFTALRSGRASIVTDRIDRFTEKGLRLASGEELAADIIVTATGLNVLALGGMTLTVDGERINLSDTVAYKGMMLSGVPNFALTLGYTNASWTLKADLVAGYVCRLLNHMAEHDYQVVTPVLTAPTTEAEPIIDLKSGYVLRAVDQLPKQGPAAPWRLHQNYPRDVLLMRHGPIDDSVRFDRVSTKGRQRADRQPA
jgi:cation diffusion facilitator CzcD-associated flavoprotein CzcO